MDNDMPGLAAWGCMIVGFLLLSILFGIGVAIGHRLVGP